MFDQKLINDLPVHQTATGTAAPVLQGLRVVDFTHFIAGPLATMTLGDFGADVIKIEAPERGDDFRHYPFVDPDIPAQGSAFLWSNRNKKSLALDMKSEAGLEVAKALITQADVLVENFSSGVMERFGLDYETCAKLNPRLIYCSVSAYGRRPLLRSPGVRPHCSGRERFHFDERVCRSTRCAHRCSRYGCWNSDDCNQCNFVGADCSAT